MKKIIFLVLCAILSYTSVFAQDGKSIYKKYSDNKDVSAVFISPAMFKLIGKLPEIQMDGQEVDVSSLISTFTGFYLLECEDEATVSGLQNDVERFVKSGNYEELMEIKDDGDNVRFYSVGDGDVITSFVMLSCESDGCTFICIDGVMPKSQLEKVLAM